MAAGTVSLTRLLDQIKAVAAAVTGLHTDRVFQGKKRVAEADNIEEGTRALTAETQGYFVFWAGPRKLFKPTVRGTFTVLGLLLVHLPKDTTSDCNSAYELAERLGRALSLQTNFASQGAGIVEVGYQLIDDTLEDGVAEFDFEMTYEVGACN